MAKVKYIPHAHVFYSCSECPHRGWVIKNNIITHYRCGKKDTKVKGKIIKGSPIPDKCPLPKVKVLD